MFYLKFSISLFKKIKFRLAKEKIFDMESEEYVSDQHHNMESNISYQSSFNNNVTQVGRWVGSRFVLCYYIHSIHDVILLVTDVGGWVCVWKISVFELRYLWSLQDNMSSNVLIEMGVINTNSKLESYLTLRYTWMFSLVLRRADDVDAISLNYLSNI